MYYRASAFPSVIHEGYRGLIGSGDNPSVGEYMLRLVRMT